MKSTDLAHALGVGNLWFTLQPVRWQYEPRERFGELVWAPDCLLVYQRKVYAVELQKSPLGRRRWERKWSVYNRYFNGGHFRQAAYQEWGKSGAILPQILVISQQDPDTVRQGFSVEGRELIIMSYKTWTKGKPLFDKG